MQEPKLEAVSLGGADAAGIDAACRDVPHHPLEIGSSTNRMDGDLTGKEMSADRRINSTTSDNRLPAGPVGQHDVIDGQPTDGDDVDHRRSPPCRAAVRAGLTAET